MNPSILLVEDDDNDAFFLERALKKAGIPTPVERVGDGREALDYFQGRMDFGDGNNLPLPRLVLLDLKLPHMMGLEVLKWIRGQAQFSSIIVLVLSASQYPTDIADAQRYGANAYLVKPSNLNQLDLVARTIADSWLNAAPDSRLRADHSDNQLRVQPTRGAPAI